MTRAARSAARVRVGRERASWARSEVGARMSVRKAIPGAGDADRVVGELVLHLRQIIVGHVAGDALRDGDGAGRVGMVGGGVGRRRGLRGGFDGMAGEAGSVVAGGLVGEGGVRVVAAGADE